MGDFFEAPGDETPGEQSDARKTLQDFRKDVERTAMEQRFNLLKEKVDSIKTSLSADEIIHMAKEIENTFWEQWKDSLEELFGAEDVYDSLSINEFREKLHFYFSCVLFLASALFLRTENNTLPTKTNIASFHEQVNNMIQLLKDGLSKNMPVYIISNMYSGRYRVRSPAETLDAFVDSVFQGRTLLMLGEYQSKIDSPEERGEFVQAIGRIQRSFRTPSIEDKGLNTSLRTLNDTYLDLYLDNIFGLDHQLDQSDQHRLDELLFKTDYWKLIQGYFDTHKTARDKLFTLPSPKDEQECDEWALILLYFCDPEEAARKITEVLFSLQTEDPPIEEIPVKAFDPISAKKFNKARVVKERFRSIVDKYEGKRNNNEERSYHYSNGRSCIQWPGNWRMAMRGKEWSGLLDVGYGEARLFDFNREEFKPWLQKVDAEGKEFFKKVASSSVNFQNSELVGHIRTTPDFYEEYTSLFIRGILAGLAEEVYRKVLNREVRTRDFSEDFSERLRKFPFRYPTFYDILFAGPNTSVTQLAREFLQDNVQENAGQMTSAQQFAIKKSELLASAREETSQAQLKYDRQKEGLTPGEKKYLDNMDRFLRESLEKVIDEIPFLFGFNPETIERVSKAVNTRKEFPSLDVRKSLERAAGQTQRKRNGKDVEARIAISEKDTDEYEDYVRIYIHELLHALVQNTGDDTFWNPIREGITEYYACRIGEKLGLKSSRAAYEGIVNFTRILEMYLGSDVLSRLYTGRDAPETDLSDLPKIGVDGKEHSLLEGVKLDTSGKRYFCRQILDRLNIAGLTYTEKRELFIAVNGFLKDLFNRSNFTKKDHALGVSSNHYARLAEQLNQLFERYGKK